MHTLNVRFMDAANRDLEELVEKGFFLNKAEAIRYAVDQMIKRMKVLD